MVGLLRLTHIDSLHRGSLSWHPKRMPTTGPIREGPPMTHSRLATSNQPFRSM